jgi:hypothetical protein
MNSGNATPPDCINDILSKKGTKGGLRSRIA